MKKLLTSLFVSLVLVAAASATAVRGTLLDLSGNPLVSGSLVFTLQNCPDSAGTAFIIGSPGKPITYTKTVTAGPGGVLIDNIIGNDQIVCGGGANTYYHVASFNGTTPGPSVDYFISGGIWNYNNAAPMASIPSSPVIQYLQLNSSGSQTVSISAGQSLTFSGSVIFTGPMSVQQAIVADITGNAATATALNNTSPAICGAGTVAIGITSTGDAICESDPGGGGGGAGSTTATPNTLMLRDGSADSGIHTLNVTGQIISTLAIGTAPLSIVSTTVVPNLNVSLLSGHPLADFSLLASIPDCHDGVASKLLFNSGTLLFSCGVDQVGSGGGGGSITSINGSVVASQSFATGTTGTAFNISTNAGTGVHTFNIPLAATGSVTAGLLSNTDYASFAAKQSTSAKGAASGYAGLDSGSHVPVAQLPTNLAYVDASPQIFTGATTFNGGVLVKALSDAVPLIVQQMTGGSPTADIIDFNLGNGTKIVFIDSVGNIKTVGSGGCISVGTSTFCAGAGAPVGSCTTGAYYSRTDGTANNTEYICQGGIWSPFGSTPTLTFTDITNQAATSARSFGQFTPDRNITITRFQVVFETAPAACSTLPIMGVVQGASTLTSLTMVNGQAAYDSGSLAVNAANTSPLSIQVTRAGVGCTAATAMAPHSSVVYRMQ